MKKYLLLLATFGIFLFTSCSDDDDNGGETTDPIVGSWVLVEVTPAGFVNPDDCEQESTLTLNRDNTGGGVFYLAGNDCEAQTSTGSWENKGNSVYSIELPVEEIGRQDGTVSFSGSNTFSFAPQSLGGIIVLTFQRQ